MQPSLLSAYTSRMTETADQCHGCVVCTGCAAWKDFTKDLFERIPPDLERFAVAMGWKVKQGEWSAFSSGLFHIAKKSHHDSVAVSELDDDDLEHFGFTCLDDVRTKMQQLEEAWEHIIEIQVNVEGGEIHLTYRGIEFENRSSP